MSIKIYVGYLPYSVTDSSLESNFSEFGSVSSAKVMMDRETGRSKGFGFVEMADFEIWIIQGCRLEATCASIKGLGWLRLYRPTVRQRSQKTTCME